MSFASEHEIVMVGQYLTGKKVSYATALDVVLVLQAFILNSNHTGPTLTVSQIGEICLGRIPAEKIRRILHMLKKNKFAECEPDFIDHNWETPFFFHNNMLGYEIYQPIEKGDFDIPIDILIKVLTPEECLSSEEGWDE
ncbi:MAG: hypothetical protein QX197_14210 [Methylococcaceae bacterium]